MKMKKKVLVLVVATRHSTPGTRFFILRLYGPLQPWFDKTWRPGEIKKVE